MIDEALREIHELTKFCYGIKTELSVIIENQNALKDSIQRINHKLEQIDATTRELEKVNERRAGYRTIAETAVRYWYVILVIVIYIAAGSSAATKLLEKMS